MGLQRVEHDWAHMPCQSCINIMPRNQRLDIHPNIKQYIDMPDGLYKLSAGYKSNTMKQLSFIALFLLMNRLRHILSKVTQEKVTDPGAWTQAALVAQYILTTIYCVSSIRHIGTKLTLNNENVYINQK